MHIVSKPQPGHQTPYASALYFLSGRWQVGVLAALRSAEAKTYEEIKSRLNAPDSTVSGVISDGVLSSVLKELEAEGCLVRSRRLSDLKVVFRSTEKSRQLMAIVDELNLWSEEFSDAGLSDGPASSGTGLDRG